MKKVSIIKNLSILLSFGVLVKALGLFNKIVLTRYLTLDGLTLYTKMVPIAGLFLTIATFSLGSTITQMVSKNIASMPYSNRDLMKKGFHTATILASIVSLIHLLTNYFICHFLLRMDILFKPFVFFIPLYYFSSYTGVMRGYFHGHNRMDIYAIGQLMEQIVRIILIYVFIAPMLSISLINGVIAAVLTLAIGEFVQNVYLVIRLFLFTKWKGKTTIKADTKQLITTSANLTSNRLLNSISGFLEPVIYTYAFFATGLAKNIGDELYAIIYGYSIPIILTTNFISAAIETSILPSLTMAYQNQDVSKYNSIINKALLLSYIPATLVSLIYFYFPYEIMQLFYHTDQGAYYIKLLAIPSFIAYFEGVFVSALMAAKREKKLVITTIITNLLHLGLTYYFVSQPRYNATGIVISLSVTLILSTLLLNYFTIKNTTYQLDLTAYLPYLLIYVLSLLSIGLLIKLGMNAYLAFSMIVIFYLAILFFQLIILPKRKNSCHPKT